MKEAAKIVGVGLPRLYEKLRERGDFIRDQFDGRNVPTRAVQLEGLFIVTEHQRWDPQFRIYRHYPKVSATYTGMILLQEIADEIATRKA
jgi:phage antirepressor YoqD-like protein